MAAMRMKRIRMMRKMTTLRFMIAAWVVVAIGEVRVCA